MFDLFDFYPEDILRPLACTKHKRFYWRTIYELYKSFYSEESQAIDSIIDVADIRFAIETTIIEYGFEVSDADEELPLNIDEVKSNSLFVFNQLKTAGWLKTDKNGVKIGVYMPPRICGLVELLYQSRFDSSEQIGSHIYALRALLRDIHSNNKNTHEDITAALKGCVSQAKAVSNLMNRLSAAMAELYERIGEVTELSSKASLFFEEFVDADAFKALDSINGNNHPYRFKAEILKIIDELEYGVARDRILQIYQVEKNGNDYAEQYLKNLRIIRNVFGNVGLLKKRVEKNHIKLTKRVSDSIHYQRRYNQGIGIFVDALKQLKELEQDCSAFDGRISVLSSPFYQDNLNLPKVRKPEIIVADTTRRIVSRRSQIRSALQREHKKLYRMDSSKLIEYLNEVFKSHPSNHIHSQSIMTDNYFQYICFSLSRRLCKPTHKTSTRYKDVLKLYSFALLSYELVEHDACICRPFEITKV